MAPRSVGPRLEVLAAAALFSTGGAAVKAISFAGWPIACLRSAIAAAAFALLVPSARRWVNWRILRVAAAYAATMILFILSNKLTTSAATIFLQATAPLYVLLLGPWLLGERIRRSDLVYMAVIEVNAAGPAALGVRDEAVGLLAALIGDEAFVTAPEPAPRLLLRTIGGSILQLIYASVLAGHDRELEELLPTIMYIVLVAIDGPQDAAIRAGLLSARTGSETG